MLGKQMPMGDAACAFKHRHEPIELDPIVMRMLASSNIVILTGAGISAESGLADVSRRRRAVGRASGRGCRDARGVCARSGAGPRNSTMRGARGWARSSPMRRMSRWRGSTPNGAGELADRHPECRRPARARRGEAAAPHARRAAAAAGACAATSGSLGRADGRGRGLPVVRRRSGRSGPTSCGSAKCPTRWSGSRRRCCDADLFVSIGTSGAVYPAAGFVQTAQLSRRADARDQPRAEPGKHLLRRAALRPRRASKCRRWVDELLS